MSPKSKRPRLSGGPSQAEPASVDSTDGASAKPVKAQSRRSLFVRSLPPSTTTDDLTELFSGSYPIKHAVAVTDGQTKKCKGYGFVTFADAEDAERAQTEFDGFAFKGQKIKVEVAEPRHRGEDAPAESERIAKRPGNQEHQPPPKLIVRNLPWSINTPDKLTKLFLSYGKVKHAVVPKKASGLMMGFGIVVIRGKKNAEMALQGVNGREVDGRTLAVDWAVDKETWQKTNGEKDDKEESMMHDNEEEEDESDGGAMLSEHDAEDAEDEDAEDDEDVDEDEDEEDEDDDDEHDEDDENEDEDEDEEKPPPRPQTTDSTIFIRNLPFTCGDEELQEHFEEFGGVRYARVVMDHATGMSRGTGFVCFYKKEDADACLKDAPQSQAPTHTHTKGPSLLQDEFADPSGRYTMDGRVLQLARAVDKSQAVRLTEEGTQRRTVRDGDKRRLYLLHEGTIASNTPLYQLLSPSEIAMREASLKQRKGLIEKNPSLHLSLTRLAIRNIPRTVTSKDLKALARQAIVGFAKDVKAGKRQPLSKEELARGGEEMAAIERDRRAKGKGVVKQAKIVFESTDGSKIAEGEGAGRSRGYGFVEYHTHRSALMGLRWLNGHAIDYKALETSKKPAPEDLKDRKKRLIVEFAIENAQVVQRRKERERKEHDNPRPAGGRGPGVRPGFKDTSRHRKRKRDADGEDPETVAKPDAVERGAKRSRPMGKGNRAKGQAAAGKPAGDGKSVGAGKAGSTSGGGGTAPKAKNQEGRPNGHFRRAKAHQQGKGKK
ncbi:RNA-binding domain-containing protein [Trichodelitschia bisporula]|uniref:RNA-binding domain-containing protein n=1 Tax=Trichodelitschia bisporula TaxID=703511 RepID=A0A6G1I5A9_9PEZI|nr:RNA-binding domain-containing protein [Trichodelitschia bisporula]